MDGLTKQEIESGKAHKRIRIYLTGGSRLVLMSRAIVGALILVISLIIWWFGLSN